MNDVLYKVIRSNKSNDLMVLWNFEEHRSETHSYVAVSNLAERAYSIQEVSELVGRSANTLRDRVNEFPEAYRIYSMTTNRIPCGRRYSADQIMEIRDILAGIHWGKPHSSGRITATGVPSRIELRAMLNHETVHFIQTKEGEFVPSWKATQF